MSCPENMFRVRVNCNTDAYDGDETRVLVEDAVRAKQAEVGFNFRWKIRNKTTRKGDLLWFSVEAESNKVPLIMQCLKTLPQDRFVLNSQGRFDVMAPDDLDLKAVTGITWTGFSLVAGQSFAIDAYDRSRSYDVNSTAYTVRLGELTSGGFTQGASPGVKDALGRKFIPGQHKGKMLRIINDSPTEDLIVRRASIEIERDGLGGENEPINVHGTMGLNDRYTNVGGVAGLPVTGGPNFVALAPGNSVAYRIELSPVEGIVGLSTDLGIDAASNALDGHNVYA